MLGVLYSSAAGLSAALAGVLIGWKLMKYQEDNLTKLPWWVWALLILGAILAALVITCSTGLLPRKLGGHTRRFWQSRLANVTLMFYGITTPLRRIASQLDKLAPPVDPAHDAIDEEIRELAQKNVREGNLTKEESTLVANAVRLDDIPVKDIMTPRVVVTALEGKMTITDVFKQIPKTPHGRYPVYEGSLDNVTGLVRRRDLLQAKADGKNTLLVRELASKNHFVPGNAMVGAALYDMVENQQQIAVVVDEFGNTSGVVSLEDIFECLIGREISEKDDIAVDMRELAKDRFSRSKPANVKKS
ncbi:MAG: CBS domain-containing protein [Puniceicoccales bacterium]|nr:CBS domain-containing protein [Puniceicoccales bacterium]